MTKTSSSSKKQKVTRRKSPRFNKKNANDATTLASVYFKDFRERTNDFQEVIPELGNINLKDVTSNTIEYQVKQGNVVDDFFDYLNTSNMYKDKMVSTDFQCKGGKIVKAPSLIIACLCTEGIIPEEKINLANQLLTGFVGQMKQKKKGHVDKDYQPNSQMTMIRTLLATMKERYSWPYTMKSFHFQGGVTMILSSLFQARLSADKTNTVSTNVI